MNLREKILAGVGATCLVGWWLSPTLYGIFLEPFDRAQSEVSVLNSDIKKLKDKEFQLIRATSHLKDAKTISLPPDPIDAQRLYQKWLTELATLAELKDISVVPKRRTTKGDIYTSVQVTVDAKASFVAINRFLKHFQETDLLHRISEFNLTSNSATGDAPLGVHIVAEGLSLPKSLPREAVFPRSKLLKDLPTSQTLLPVEKTDIFPKQFPFRIKVNEDFMDVQSVNGNSFVVVRGQAETKPQLHPGESTVELFPVSKTPQSLSMDDFQKLTKMNPFIKYQPVAVTPPMVIKKPKLKSLADLNLFQGDPLKQAIKLDDWRPELGKIIYKVSSDTLANLTINQETGEVTLASISDLMPESYPVSIIVKSEKDPELTLSGSFRVNVKQRNSPPVFDLVSPQTAYQDQPFRVKLLAKDADTKQRLSYSLGASKITDLKLESETGLLEFTPGQNIAPGVYSVEVNVSDNATPPATVGQTIEINVVEDPARHTFLVANILDEKQKVIWLYNRLDNVRFELKEVDLFAVADLFGGVVKIEYDYVILGIDGGLYRLKTGQNLRQLIAEPIPVQPKSDSVKSGVSPMGVEALKSPAPYVSNQYPPAPFLPEN